MGFSHHAWWLFAGFWDPTTCIEKNVKKGHEFCHPKGRGCSSLNFSSPKGVPGLKKPPGCGGPKSQIIGDLRPPKKKGDDLRATWMGPQGCVHLGWGERCKENVLSNIFRVQFVGVFAVTHVLQMES